MWFNHLIYGNFSSLFLIRCTLLSYWFVNENNNLISCFFIVFTLHCQPYLVFQKPHTLYSLYMSLFRITSVWSIVFYADLELEVWLLIYVLLEGSLTWRFRFSLFETKKALLLGYLFDIVTRFCENLVGVEILFSF